MYVCMYVCMYLFIRRFKSFFSYLAWYLPRFYLKIATLINAIEKKIGNLKPSSLVERSMNQARHQRNYFWCVEHTNDQQINDIDNMEEEEGYINNNENHTHIDSNDNTRNGQHNHHDDNDDNKFYLYEDKEDMKSGGFVDNFHVRILRVMIEILVDIVCLITVIFTFISPIRIYELISCLLISSNWLTVWSMRQCMRKMMVMDQMIQEFKIDLSRELNTDIKQNAYQTTSLCNLSIEKSMAERLNGKYLKSFKKALLEAQQIGNQFCDGDNEIFMKFLPDRVRYYEELLFYYCIMMSVKQWTMTNESMENEDLRDRLCVVVQIMDERLKKIANKLEVNYVACHKSLHETIENAKNCKKWKIGILSNSLQVTRGLVMHQCLSALKDIVAILMLIFILMTFVRVIPMFREMYYQSNLRDKNHHWNSEQVYLVLRKNVVGATQDIMNIGKFTFYAWIGQTLLYIHSFIHSFVYSFSFSFIHTSLTVMIISVFLYQPMSVHISVHVCWWNSQLFIRATI